MCNMNNDSYYTYYHLLKIETHSDEHYATVATMYLPRVEHMHLAQLSLPQVLQRMGCGESVGRVLPSSSSLPVAVSP